MDWKQGRMVELFELYVFGKGANHSVAGFALHLTTQSFVFDVLFHRRRLKAWSCPVLYCKRGHLVQTRVTAMPVILALGICDTNMSSWSKHGARWGK